MPYQMVSNGTYPGTDLPAFLVFDAEDYNDPMIKHPRPIGEVWGVGERGTTRFILTGFRWGLAGEDMLVQARRAEETEPFRSSSDAASAMVAAYEASGA